MDLLTYIHVLVHVFWIEWGKAWWLKFYLLHGVYNLFEKQCGCTKNITMNPHISSNVRFQQVQTVTYIYIYLPRSIFTYIVYHIIYDMHQSAISLNSSRINPKTQLCANANGILQETYSQCTIKPKVRDKLEQNICTAVLCFWVKRLWHEGWMFCI